MSLILSFIALILFVFIYIVYLFFTMFYKTKGRKWYKLVDAKMFTLAYRIDVFANFVFADLWNAILIKTGGYEFGRLGETISSAIGRNMIRKELSIFGWFLGLTIDLIDIGKWKSGFKGEGFHCAYYIQTDQQIKQFYK